MIYFDTKRTVFGLCTAGLLTAGAVESRAQGNKGADTSTTALEEFVVTAQYQPQSLRKSVYKMNVIDQKRIQAKAVTNAQQILSGELGIRFNNDMSLGTADISLMGMNGRNIKILMDGVPLLDRGDVRESLNQINVAQIERIEIVEGPMSIMYGSDALAGIINIITKKPESETIQINAQIGEETAGNEYSFGTGKGLHTQQLSGSWDNGKLSVQASVLHYDFGGWGGDSYNRAHAWKPKEQLLPSLRIGYRAKNWDILYRNDYLLETITTKGKINTDVYRATNQFFTTSRMAHQLQHNHNWNSKWFLNSSLAYTDYTRYTKTDLIDYNDRTITPTTGAGEQDTASFNSVNFRTSLLYVHNKKLSIQPGFEYSYDNAFGARIVGTPQITNIAGFLTAEYKPTDKLNIRPGIRMNKNSIYDAPPVIPSINTLYRINDNFSVRASYARGFRAPALRELYFEFRDANHNIVGNENLKAENSNSVNLSFAYRKPLQENRMYSTEIGYFYNSFNNLIDMAVSATNPQEYTMVNIDNYKTTGFSLSNKFVTRKVEWRLGGLLLGQFNYLSQDETFKDEVSYFNWATEFNVEMMYNILATKTKINVFYKYTGPRSNYRIENEKLVLGKTSGFNIADLNVQQQIVPSLKLTLGVRNLLNISEVNNTSVIVGAHSSSGNLPFSYGRSYFATVSYNFNNQLK